MRIIVVTICSLLVFFLGLLTVKFWGKAQTYAEYPHVMLQGQGAPIEFFKPSYAQLNESLASNKNLFLDVTVTFDQKLVIPKRKFVATEKPIKLFKYDEIKNDVLLVVDLKEQLNKRKIIFNMVDNARAIHETFIYDLKAMGMDKGDGFIVTSQYEAPIKALKELAPAFVYGSTQPEVLKIVAMQSMHVLEAVSIRADVIIHPLKIRNQLFYNDEIIQELKRRHKKIIIGPIGPDELLSAQQLNPFGIILKD